MTEQLDAHKLEEMAFHDQRERDRHALTEHEYERKYSNKKWYAVTQRSSAYVERWLDEHAPGKVALDYCCGLGGMSVQLAQKGAEVYGIDISPESVETSRRAVADAGYGHNSHFQVMDAEQLTFPDDMFDVIIVFGVLHHLDVTKAFPELSRVLKPGGKILCGEALGYNPVIAAYRRLTPKLRTSWEADHILKMKELQLARRYFRRIDVHFFHLFAVLAAWFRKTAVFQPLLAVLNAMDDVVLRIPGVRLMAWQMLFVLSDPIKSNRGSTHAPR